MQTVLELKPLYSQEKNGKTRIWKAEIRYDAELKIAYAIIEFGQDGGKMQTTTREYQQGKNIGKKNETSSLEQCTQETQRKWKDKKEKEGYTEEISKKNEDTYYPMLAQTYDPSKSSVTYPCFVQPKLDGLRCIVYVSESDRQIVFQSRTGGRFYTMDHLIPSLMSLFGRYPDTVLDGELYTTDLPFEELAGLIKKRKVSHEDTERLKHVSYHIYDIISDEPFSERCKRLQTILNPPYPYLKIVPSTIVSSIPEFKEQFNDFVANGMEGIMLRNISGLYRCNYRSNDLQKYKEFFEEEYKIIGFKEGDGRDKGAVIWECQCGDSSFWVRPRGTMEKRQEWFRDGLSYVGKMITVIYQELSDMGIPRFPVGKSIRDGF
jgi:DNA ligase-1